MAGVELEYPSSSTNLKMIEFWKSYFDLVDWEIRCEQISMFQVSDEFCRVGNQLVGIVMNSQIKLATLFHTRKLREEDIIHELLHVRSPAWSEDQVNEEMNKLKNRRIRKILPKVSKHRKKEKYERRKTTTIS